jgi:surface protein
MNHMFADCHKLANINFTGWQTDSLTNMDAAFNHCKALKSVDLSMFNTSKVTKMCQMFEACESLEEIIGLENFDTSLVTDFSEMFTSTKLTTLDLSSFNTASAKVIYSMFNGNQLLETIYVGDGWNMSQATSYNNLFDNCINLVGGNGTAYAGSGLQYACVDTQETPGYLTYKSAT